MRFLVLLVFVVAFNSCCHLPFVDCIANVKKIKTNPQAVLFENKISKQVTVKAWLLESRDKKNDFSTLDFELEFSGDFPPTIPVTDLIQFNHQNYFELRGGSIFIEPTTVKIEAKKSDHKNQQKIVVSFSVIVTRKDIYNPEIKKVLVINDILLADEKIKFESTLNI